MNHLKVTGEDHTTPIPMEVVADLGNALLDIVEHLPIDMPLTLASLKRLVIPLTAHQAIVHSPGRPLPWLFDDTDRTIVPFMQTNYFSTRSLAQLLVEVLTHQATVSSDPQTLGTHIRSIRWRGDVIDGICGHCGIQTLPFDPKPVAP